MLVILNEVKDLLLILKLLKPRSFGQKRPQDDKTITPASRDDKMLSSRVSESTRDPVFAVILSEREGSALRLVIPNERSEEGSRFCLSS